MALKKSVKPEAVDQNAKKTDREGHAEEGRDGNRYERPEGGQEEGGPEGEVIYGIHRQACDSDR
jgi:hypothetical protein